MRRYSPHVRRKLGTLALLLLGCALLLGPVAAHAADVEAAIPLLNPAPVANPDAYATYQETPLSVVAPGVLANDSAGPLVDATAQSMVTDMVVPVAPSLIATLPTQPANGSVKLNADGSFEYTPGVGFVGVDTFTYRAQLVFPVGPNAQGFLPISEPTTVTISVLPVVLDRPITRFIVSRRRSFEVYGFITPGHPEGSQPVTVECYRWERRRWVLKQTELMTAYNWPRPSKYGAWIRLRQAGKWRLVAVHQHPGGAPTYSSWRVLYVR